MSRKSITYVVLFMSLAILGFLIYPQFQQRLDEQRSQKQAEALAAEAKREVANAAKLPRPDFDMQFVPKAYPRPRSAWRVAEKAFYESILTKGRFEVLVVPFQVQDFAFARDLRSLMSAHLASAIAQAGGAPVPDPYLVARALGDGERRFELTEIFRLANALGAKRIVVGYVGHDYKRTMRVTLHSYERSEPEPFTDAVFAPQPGKIVKQPVASDRLKSAHFEKPAFSEETTPLDAYQALLPAMLGFLGVDAAKLEAAKAVSRFEGTDLPASPLATASEPAEPARDAYFLQLMAALTPQSADRERERLIEKSMLAVLSMSPESLDYRLLKARALMNLGLRPAALRALGTPASAEEKHLFALLNGNLPVVQEQKAQIPAGVRAFIAALERNAIVTAYKVNDEKRRLAEVKALKLPGDTWAYLALRAMTDSDGWAQFDNLELKALLDRELPVDGFTAESMLRGAAAVADTDKIRYAMDLSVLEHVRKYMQASAGQSCCQPLAARATRVDLLDLADGIATDNLTRRATFLGFIQGRPEAALQFLARIENTYKDHPDFTLVRAEVERAMAEAASGAEQEGLRRSARAGAFNVWYWEQGQTRAAADADQYVIARGGRHQEYGGFPRFYTNDYPFRPFYLGSDVGQTGNALKALENSCFDFWPATHLEWTLGQIDKKWAEVDQLMRSLEGRFDGNPDRIRLMAQSSARRGDLPAAERYYAEAIRAQPTAEGLYTELGKLLFDNGLPDKSARVFMSYPGLKNHSLNRVGIANYAYEAGSLYYWSGDFAHALPLYKQAAELRTGSASSMTSEIRLALLNGNYAAALRGSLERGRRYNSPHAYRDYLGLLHAMGYSKAAWDGFTTLVAQTDEPQVWETALVGHRIEGASEANVAKWAAQEPMRSGGRSHPYAPRYAPIYMLHFGVTDRMPSPDLPAHIAGLEPVEAKAKGKSSLVYYAEAYTLIRSGNFEAARAMLEQASTVHPMSEPSLGGHLLAAYAYAAARSRNTAAVEKLLDGMPIPFQRFDYQLARAILTGVSGKRDESMQHLKLALHRRPFTERRPLYTEYQYAEVCEWLFEATRDPRYRSAALDWAKKNQAFHPWFSWAYAMEARLTTNAADRAAQSRSRIT